MINGFEQPIRPCKGQIQFKKDEKLNLFAQPTGKLTFLAPNSSPMRVAAISKVVMVTLL